LSPSKTGPTPSKLVANLAWISLKIRFFSAIGGLVSFEEKISICAVAFGRLKTKSTSCSSAPLLKIIQIIASHYSEKDL
jgi:hypothetical protein